MLDCAAVAIRVFVCFMHVLVAGGIGQAGLETAAAAVRVPVLCGTYRGERCCAVGTSIANNIDTASSSLANRPNITGSIT